MCGNRNYNFFPCRCSRVCLEPSLDMHSIFESLQRETLLSVLPREYWEGSQGCSTLIHDAHGEDCTDAAESDAMPCA